MPLTASRDADVLADAVHERIRDAILRAEFRPNHRLVEEELAAWLNVSRTPIREALMRLRHEGLVVRTRGWVVRDPEPSEVVQILEARAAVESYAAGLAALRMGAEDIAKLKALTVKMEEPGAGRQQTNLLNNDFHEIITDAAGNYLLSQFHRRTRSNYWNFNVPVVFTPEDDEAVNRDHHELIAAIEARDAAKCSAIAKAHVELTVRIVKDALGIGDHTD